MKTLQQTCILGITGFFTVAGSSLAEADSLCKSREPSAMIVMANPICGGSSGNPEKKKIISARGRKDLIIIIPPPEKTRRSLGGSRLRL